MHFEVLVEDASGKLLLDEILPRLLATLDGTHSHRTIAYKGIGRIPKGLTPQGDPRKRILLDQLPRVLKGYGRSLQAVKAAVVVVLDLDSRDRELFQNELEAVLTSCNPSPRAVFSLAIEEIEAWLLGDPAACRSAYPRAKERVLSNYVQDSICGTWELLADALESRGAEGLKAQGWPAAGVAKCTWARRIGPFMDIERNRSPSFQVFRKSVAALADE